MRQGRGRLDVRLAQALGSPTLPASPSLSPHLSLPASPSPSPSPRLPISMSPSPRDERQREAADVKCLITRGQSRPGLGARATPPDVRGQHGQGVNTCAKIWRGLAPRPPLQDRHANFTGPRLEQRKDGGFLVIYTSAKERQKSAFLLICISLEHLGLIGLRARQSLGHCVLVKAGTGLTGPRWVVLAFQALARSQGGRGAGGLLWCPIPTSVLPHGALVPHPHVCPAPWSPGAPSPRLSCPVEPWCPIPTSVLPRRALDADYRQSLRAARAAEM
ncbi:unnamed protein product [Arctogadus glacialis]